MEGSAHTTRGGGKPACSWWVESICQHCLRDTHKTCAPSRGELVGKSRSKGPSQLQLHGQCCGECRGLCPEGWQSHPALVQICGAPCCTEDNVSHCNHKYLWLQLHSFLKDIHYFFDSFCCLLICHWVQAAKRCLRQEFITVHCAPLLHHSAFPSSVPDIFSYPAAQNLARREFQSHLCPRGLSLSATHL